MSRIETYRASTKRFLYLYSYLLPYCRGTELKNKMTDDYSALWKIIPILLDKPDVSDDSIRSILELSLKPRIPDDEYSESYIRLLVDRGLLDYIPDNVGKDRVIKDRFNYIWDTLHFIGLKVDRTFVTYENMATEERKHFKMFMGALKTILFNLWTTLLCPICVEHYKGLRGVLLEAMEKLEVGMMLSDLGRPIVFTTSEVINAIEPHHLSQTLFRFHNSVNNYRGVQQGRLELYRPITWASFSKSIGIN